MSFRRAIISCWLSENKFYSVEVGSGDSGLLTLRAKEILEAADVAYHVKKHGELSAALTIARGAADILLRLS